MRDLLATSVVGLYTCLTEFESQFNIMEYDLAKFEVEKTCARKNENKLILK